LQARTLLRIGPLSFESSGAVDDQWLIYRAMSAIELHLRTSVGHFQADVVPAPCARGHAGAALLGGACNIHSNGAR